MHGTTPQKVFRFNHKFLDTYLAYVDETESPRIMHLWAAISGMGACLGRRVYFPFGESNIYPNQYVLLVGPPAVKKSTAIQWMSKRVRAATGVRFAPNDTGGQRQGLIRAISGDSVDAEEKAALEELQNASVADMVTGLSQLKLSNPADRHCMYVAASEFQSFIGQNNNDLINFLLEMWDGVDYEYTLKQSSMVLEDPLLSLIGGTTPASIATSFPAQTIGGGFMSRLILVYADKKDKSVPRPPRPNPHLQALVEEFYRKAYALEGEVRESDEAKQVLDDLYTKEIKLNDPRFLFYSERRQAHLIKLAMCLMAAEGRLWLEPNDYLLADNILSMTELGMPEALGEYGTSPASVSKQRILDYIKGQNNVVTDVDLWAVLHRDMRRVDYENALVDLQNANKIQQVDLKGRGIGYVYKAQKSSNIALQLANLLSEIN